MAFLSQDPHAETAKSVNRLGLACLVGLSTRAIRSEERLHYRKHEPHYTVRGGSPSISATLSKICPVSGSPQCPSNESFIIQKHWSPLSLASENRVTLMIPHKFIWINQDSFDYREFIHVLHASLNEHAPDYQNKHSSSPFVTPTQRHDVRDAGVLSLPVAATAAVSSWQPAKIIRTAGFGQKLSFTGQGLKEQTNLILEKADHVRLYSKCATFLRQLTLRCRTMIGTSATSKQTGSCRGSSQMINYSPATNSQPSFIPMRFGLSGRCLVQYQRGIVRYLLRRHTSKAIRGIGTAWRRKRS